jgi:hypothetical protein
MNYEKLIKITDNTLATCARLEVRNRTRPSALKNASAFKVQVSLKRLPRISRMAWMKLVLQLLRTQLTRLSNSQNLESHNRSFSHSQRDIFLFLLKYLHGSEWCRNLPSMQLIFQMLDKEKMEPVWEREALWFEDLPNFILTRISRCFCTPQFHENATLVSWGC